ncbi:BRCT domain-containing protein [Arachis hypogaea]|nr:BRCT domain-containing protein [Arachis hypogaea]
MFHINGASLSEKGFPTIDKEVKGQSLPGFSSVVISSNPLHSTRASTQDREIFAAAASGRWILKTDFLTASNQAGEFVEEEPYEWHDIGLNEDGTIDMEAPRKWRLLKERTGHGAFYGMRIIVYGDCITPPLDTLKRVVKAGDGTILATSPPYTRFLGTGIDYAIVTPGMPRVDLWVQEFLRYEIPCISADYLVEYVCKPSSSLEKHVLYDTHVWAEGHFPNTRIEQKRPLILKNQLDRGDVMLICGDESGSVGCGVGTHIDCCDPPLMDVPEEDWFCSKCIVKRNCSNSPKKRKRVASPRVRENDFIVPV